MLMSRHQFAPIDFLFLFFLSFFVFFPVTGLSLRACGRGFPTPTPTPYPPTMSVTLDYFYRKQRKKETNHSLVVLKRVKS